MNISVGQGGERGSDRERERERSSDLEMSDGTPPHTDLTLCIRKAHNMSRTLEVCSQV